MVDGESWPRIQKWCQQRSEWGTSFAYPKEISWEAVLERGGNSLSRERPVPDEQDCHAAEGEHDESPHARIYTKINPGALPSGGVTGQPGQPGKTVALEMTVKDGRIDDLLSLITEDKNPSMTGSLSLHARIKVPAGPLGFLKKLELEGDFGAGNERFTNAAVQVPLNRLSESARGENKKQEAEDPETVLSNLKGHISVKNGIATLSDISFSAPGTLAQIRGTYNLLDKNR